MTDWIDDNFGKFILILIGIATALTIWSSGIRQDRYNVFMDECKLDHKAYECEMKWAVADGKARRVPP